MDVFGRTCAGYSGAKKYLKGVDNESIIIKRKSKT